MDYAIETNGLSKLYGNSRVLEDVSFRVQQGGFFAVVGKNGVGKSTLMRILMRYEQPTAGQGWIFGRSLDSDSPAFNRDIGYVSESIDYAVPTTLQNFFHHYRRLHPKWDQGVFQTILKEVNVSLQSQFRDLSRGQKMQVAFAAVLSARPKLLLLDEITAVMDAHARAFFMQYLGKFASEGGTVIMATNIISEVQHFAKHVLLLHEGNLKLNCPTTDIAKNFHKVRKMPKTNDPIFSDPECHEVTVNSDGSISYVLPTENAHTYVNAQSLRDMRAITIEEIFIYLTRSRWK